MATYKWLFNSSRYPAKPSGTVARFDSQANSHIVVIHKNRFFVVPLADASGRDPSAAELEMQFTPPIGVLTSDNRDALTVIALLMMTA